MSAAPARAQDPPELAAFEAGPAPDPGVELMIGEAGPKGRRATRRTVHSSLEHDPHWTRRFRHDVFGGQLLLDGEPVTDAALTRASCWVEEVYQATPSRDLVHEVAVCVGEDHGFHPVREWLAGLSCSASAGIGASRCDPLATLSEEPDEHEEDAPLPES